VKPCDDMDFRKAFAKAREKVKHGLSKIRKKREGSVVNVGGEGFDHSALSLQSGPDIVAEGEVRGEDSGASGREDNPAPRPDDSESMSPSVAGRGHDLGGSDDHVSGGETDRRGLHLDPHVRTETGSGQEGRDQVDTLQSDIRNRTPTPILRGGESEGM